jgi:hypothetical protein
LQQEANNIETAQCVGEVNIPVHFRKCGPHQKLFETNLLILIILTFYVMYQPLYNESPTPFMFKWKLSIWSEWIGKTEPLLVCFIELTHRIIEITKFDLNSCKIEIK